MNIKDNYHMGCVVLFILAAVIFTVYSIPRLKEMEAQRAAEQERKDSARVNNAYRTYERVHRQLLMEDPDYAELYEETENLKERLKRIKDYAEEAQGNLDYFEGDGYDVSDIQDDLSNILDECEY